MIDKAKALGQVFTREEQVEFMLSLRQNKGSILEPSCGDGAFLDRLPEHAIGIEIDPDICPARALRMDFFDYPLSRTFDTIVGNPPYVGFKDIPAEIRTNLPMGRFNQRSNLYMFFIEKAIRHLNPGGEIIFITPREFMKATSARYLNQFILESGTITHMFDLGDQRVFDRACPNVAIWRFERDNFNRQCQTERGVRQLTFSEGHLLLGPTNGIPFKACFDVRVGAISGADDLFAHPDGIEFVISSTRETGQTRRMIYNQPHPDLLPHKSRLLARGIRDFDESNWYEWGRNCPADNAPRLYVNFKTRRSDPFFVHPCLHYNSAILGIFPRRPVQLEHCRDLLNSVDWAELGFLCDDRYLFSVGLEGCVLPDQFSFLSSFRFNGMSA